MKRRYISLLVLALAFASLTCVAQSTMGPWLTRSADNSRSGWNPHASVLTQASVQSKGVVRATIIPVIGAARGMEAQPLVLPNVNTSRGTRDVMVLPSMADVVRGVDAHDGSGIWQVTLGMPITDSVNIDSKLILNIADGSQVVPPVLIQGTSGTQDFNAAMRKQRSSLVETNINEVKTVFGCSGTIYETGGGLPTIALPSMWRATR
jgi:hypothetical protein